MTSHIPSTIRSLFAVAALAAVVGCRLPGRTKEIQLPTIAVGSNADPAHPVVPASMLTGVPPSQAGTYTISLAVFIPNNHVLAPAIHPQSYAGAKPKRLVFSGDDRGFDVDAMRYRAKQVVTLVPAAAVDADGLYDDSQRNLGGLTESFIADLALADGKIDHRDHEGSDAEPGPRALHEKVNVDTSGMLIDDPVRLGPNRVSVRLHTARSGGPRDQLIAGAPSIDWDLTLTLDTSGPEPKYELTGKWDGYPAMEIYVNRQPIYRHKGEDRPPTMGDLLKLAPGYGDLTVTESGALRK